MVPVTLIVGALAVGAVAATKDVTAQAIEDAYSGLKSLIRQNYAKASGSVLQLQKKTESEGLQAIATVDLQEVGPDKHEAIVTQAKMLLDLLTAAGQVGIAVGGNVHCSVSAGNLAKPSEPNLQC